MQNYVVRKFLNERKGKPADVIIKNGYQIHGSRIVDWDDVSLLVDADGLEMLVMMDAVSTIVAVG